MIIKMASAQENINSISWNSLRGGNIFCRSRWPKAVESEKSEITSVLSDLDKIFSKLTELLPSQSNLSSCSSGCRVSFESNRLLISLSNDSLFSQIFKIATEETPPTAKNNTPRKNWWEKKAISSEFVLLWVNHTTSFSRKIRSVPTKLFTGELTTVRWTASKLALTHGNWKLAVPIFSCHGLMLT